MSTPRSIPPEDPPMKPTDPFSRRQMLAAGTAATTFTIVPRHVLGGPGYATPSAKLNIAGICLGGMGTGDVQNVASYTRWITLFREASPCSMTRSWSSPPPNSWYHAAMAQELWPTLPVILEHEHYDYGGSKARKAWSGDLLVKSALPLPDEDRHHRYKVGQIRLLPAKG